MAEWIGYVIAFASGLTLMVLGALLKKAMNGEKESLPAFPAPELMTAKQASKLNDLIMDIRNGQSVHHPLTQSALARLADAQTELVSLQREILRALLAERSKHDR